MTSQTSRRSFLELSALGLVAAIAPSDVIQPAAVVTGSGSQTPNIGSEISIWVTSGDERFAAAPLATWHAVSDTPGADRIGLNPSLKFQQIVGFGGAFTDAACYTFNRLALVA